MEQMTLDGAKRSKTSALANERGKSFEAAITNTARHYERLRQMVLRKVDPPTFPIRIGGQMVMRPKRSPFLDFVGAWTERGGRAVFIEAKSINQATLPINVDRGLKVDQWNSLRVWHWAGAVTGVLWRHSNGVCWITYDQLRVAFEGGLASVHSRDGCPVEVDWARDRVDFLPVLRALADGKPPRTESGMTETQD